MTWHFQFSDPSFIKALKDVATVSCIVLTIGLFKPRPGQELSKNANSHFSTQPPFLNVTFFQKKKKNTVTRFIVGLGKRKVQEDTGGLAYFSLGHYIRHISSVCYPRNAHAEFYMKLVNFQNSACSYLGLFSQHTWIRVQIEALITRTGVDTEC